MKKFLCISIMVVFLNGAAVAYSSASLHSIWSELLSAYVVDGVVDYSGLKSQEKKLDEYLDALDSIIPSELSDKDRLAMYINAYNAYTVKLILDNFKEGKPVASIKRLGGFFSGPWKISFCRIGGEVYTLDNIEHDIIRPLFREPRIHFAINCAAKSCPPLISAAYEGETLEEQLEKNGVDFVNNQKFNRLVGSTLYVSKIFKWFAEDFNNDILKFFTTYARGELKKTLELSGESVEIKYLEYDWALNGR